MEQWVKEAKSEQNRIRQELADAYLLVWVRREHGGWQPVGAKDISEARRIEEEEHANGCPVIITGNVVTAW